MARVDEIRKLLGQSFYIAFAGLEVPKSIQEFISKNNIGGVTLFANNYESPTQIAELTNELQATAIPTATNGAPLAIAVDHEGGKVQRFKKPFTLFPEARTIGDSNSPKLAFECAEIQAKELKAVGVNVTYAPVADINTNPSNPVIGRRAFGDTEEIVSKMVSAYIRGYVTNGVQAVVKHFPGHGDTSQDSHFHLPKVSTPIETLMARELKPFSKSFKARCEMVMTAHIIVEAIEPKLPATLSTKILQDILRTQMRYRGLILSDDMEMKAISDNFGEIEAPLMAIEAGCDVLLYHTEPAQMRAFEGLMSKLTSPQGKEAVKMLEASSKRILDFKKRNFIPYRQVQIPEIAALVGKPEHHALAQKIS